jgi:hypothetical protein
MAARGMISCEKDGRWDVVAALQGWRHGTSNLLQRVAPVNLGDPAGYVQVARERRALRDYRAFVAEGLQVPARGARHTSFRCLEGQFNPPRSHAWMDQDHRSGRRPARHHRRKAPLGEAHGAVRGRHTKLNASRSVRGLVPLDAVARGRTARLFDFLPFPLSLRSRVRGLPQAGPVSDDGIPERNGPGVFTASSPPLGGVQPVTPAWLTQTLNWKVHLLSPHAPASHGSPSMHSIRPLWLVTPVTSNPM